MAAMRRPSPICRCTLQILSLLRARGLGTVAQWLAHSLRDVTADPICRLAQRVIVQMRVALGRGGVGVPQQLADDRKA